MASCTSPLPKRPEAFHAVRCLYCRTEFNLFAAHWCPHLDSQPSKLCPSCNRCLCDHPAYDEPLFWKDPPALFRSEGFQRLFLFYL
jgi:hypothetical protein